MFDLLISVIIAEIFLKIKRFFKDIDQLIENNKSTDSNHHQQKFLPADTIVYFSHY